MRLQVFRLQGQSAGHAQAEGETRASMSDAHSTDCFRPVDDNHLIWMRYSVFDTSIRQLAGREPQGFVPQKLRAKRRPLRLMSLPAVLAPVPAAPSK